MKSGTDRFACFLGYGEQKGNAKKKILGMNIKLAKLNGTTSVFY